MRRIVGLILGCCAALAFAGEPCRIAYDLGSSGIRVGASNSSLTERIDLDFLKPLWSGKGLADLTDTTISALRELPLRAGFNEACERVGGGYSAWRLAWQQNPEELLAVLARIRAESGVAVLVMPQTTEGSYAYRGARQALGEKLTTSHVLDIGGGSLQIAGEHSGFGAALGQKIWRRALCMELRGEVATPCALQPLGAEELRSARRFAQDQLAGIRRALPEKISLTAVSRPVTRGILPALIQLSGAAAPLHRIDRNMLSLTIDRLAETDIKATAGLLGKSPAQATFLLSDMLLLEGLLRATGVEQLEVAEVNIDNLSGMLEDARAYAWGRQYPCYLQKLRERGPEAFEGDPALCPETLQ